MLHAHYIAMPKADQRLEAHQAIMRGDAPSPYRYRIAIPYAVEGAATVVSRLTGLAQRTVTGALYEAQLFLSLAAGLVLFWFYLRRWLSDEAALVGCLYLSSLIGFTFMYVLLQPWGWWEFPVFTAGLWLAQEKRRVALAALIVAGTLMRETVALLAPLYFLTRWRTDSAKSVFTWTAILGGSGALTVVGLRLWLGWAPHVGAELENPLTYRLMHNLTTLMPAATLVLFYNVLWYFAMRRHPAQPESLRRCLWYVPLFLAIHGVAAHMNESRYYLTIAPVVMPLALIAMFPGQRAAREEVSAASGIPASS